MVVARYNASSSSSYESDEEEEEGFGGGGGGWGRRDRGPDPDYDPALDIERIEYGHSPSSLASGFWDLCFSFSAFDVWNSRICMPNCVYMLFPSNCIEWAFHWIGNFGIKRKRA